ncbi:MAG: hypothetical protein JKY95_04865 [Planctomycetaceae bacterium]|nr:hypothetical protein [Planctomycetaceae bacterium]
MTNTLFPTSASVSLDNDLTDAINIPELLQSLIWKKKIDSELSPLLNNDSLQLFAQKLKSFLPCKPKQQRKYSQSLLCLLDYLAFANATQDVISASEHQQSLPALLQQLLELKDETPDSTSKQQFDTETWLAELHGLLTHEWSQLESDLNANVSQSRLLDLYLLTNILLLGADLLTEDLFISLWSLLQLHLDLVSQVLELPYQSEEAPLESMITRGELPCLLGLIFGRVLKSVDLFSAGKKSLAVELNELTDTDGTPHASLLPILPQYMESVLRCSMTAKWFEQKLLTSSAEQRWDDLIERAAALTIGNGQLWLTSSFPSNWQETLHASLSRHSSEKLSHWAVQTFAA